MISKRCIVQTSPCNFNFNQSSTSNSYFREHELLTSPWTDHFHWWPFEIYRLESDSYDSFWQKSTPRQWKDVLPLILSFWRCSQGCKRFLLLRFMCCIWWTVKCYRTDMEIHLSYRKLFMTSSWNGQGSSTTHAHFKIFLFTFSEAALKHHTSPWSSYT